MTAEEFEKGYCKRSNLSLEKYRKWRVTMPCECEYEGCEGWASIPNDPESIAHQKQFHSPVEVE